MSTNVADFMSDLNGGMGEQILSRALSEAAAASVDNDKPSEVTMVFKIKPIKGTHQATVEYQIKFKKPTTLGEASETACGDTVMHVGKGGTLSLAQPDLLKQESILNA